MTSADAGAARAVVLNHVSAVYQDGALTVQALSDVNLHVLPGEFVSVIGPSGCGKSTMLGLIAALKHPASGEILVNDVPLDEQSDRVALMPQRDLLLPWRTVLENVILGPELRKRNLSEERTKALALMPQFGLSGFADAYPRALSGGMRQRAALLRTILLQRDIMLLDEPFGALDALTRIELQEWLLTICSHLEKTVLFVTHDVDEAIYLSDRVYLMSSRPGTVRHTARIHLPRPRRRDMTSQPTFVNAKRDLLEILLHESPSSVETDAVSSETCC